MKNFIKYDYVRALVRCDSALPASDTWLGNSDSMLVSAKVLAPIGSIASASQYVIKLDKIHRLTDDDQGVRIANKCDMELLRSSNCTNPQECGSWDTCVSSCGK